MTDNHQPSPFLERVAGAYVANEADRMADCCFVFPNKRSATFFLHYLQSMVSPPAIMPATKTISEFVAGLSPLVEASRVDRLFILYNEYNRLMDEPVEFDRFVYWGEMLLNDFDDVDRYLVDASSLFVNVRRFREIRSNYLTPEQLRIISRYWDGVEDYTGEIERFWQHTGGDSGASPGSAEHFIKLWMVLDELYNAYHERLQASGLTSPGRLYRDAVTTLKDELPPEFDRYVFVGFNVLSASELRIFDILKTRGKADFYWDVPAPAFRGVAAVRDGVQTWSNKAMRFISRNVAAFPSRYDIDSGLYDGASLPEIAIVNVPSRVGQAKVAGRQILDWISDGTVDPSNAIDTAVVMPDESLFVTTVNSMPPKVGSLNVTMGYPLRRTPVATFMHTVISLHMRARSSGGKWYFFYEDILAVLSHSVASTIDDEASRLLSDMVTKERRFMIAADLIRTNFPTLAPIFAPVTDDRDMACVTSYVNGVLDLLERSLAGVENRRDRAIHSQFLHAYKLALSRLSDAAAHHGVVISESTCFHLVERAMASETITMKGEPLRGLQLMGVLETRALDFSNVIIMSMNENVFPRKSYARSFIPDALRHAYRMSTIEHQESIFAYYFYRLISRASRVTLLYDGRTVGLRHSEMSRYLVQLLYAFRRDLSISHVNAVFSGRAYDALPVTVRKDGRVMRLLDRYLTPGSGVNLSASAINCYIDCPLQFYLRYVEGLDSDDPATDYIDASTFGRIVHETAQELYMSASPDHRYPVVINRSDIEKWISKDDDTISRFVHQAIDRLYFNMKEGWGESVLQGETLVTARLITSMLREMLARELPDAPFTVIDAEQEINTNLEIVPGLRVNVRQFIDRIDMVGGVKRIVDYKTGNDDVVISDWSKAFDPSFDRRAKAIVQLFFYCHVYRLVHDTDEPLKPVIYSLRKLFTDGIRSMRIARGSVDDYHDFYDEFLGLFNEVIRGIFDPEKPFEQSPDVGGHACTFCKFKLICGVDETAS